MCPHFNENLARPQPSPDRPPPGHMSSPARTHVPVPGFLGVLSPGRPLELPRHLSHHHASLSSPTSSSTPILAGRMHTTPLVEGSKRNPDPGHPSATLTPPPRRVGTPLPPAHPVRPRHYPRPAGDVCPLDRRGDPDTSPPPQRAPNSVARRRSPAGTVATSCPLELPTKAQVRGMRDRKRDRSRISATATTPPPPPTTPARSPGTYVLPR